MKIELTEWGQWIDRVFKNADYDLTVIGHAEPFDINIYANPKYYFRYDSPKFQETLKKAEMEAGSQNSKRTLHCLPEDHHRGCGEWIFICIAQSSHYEERDNELVEGLSDDRRRCHRGLDTEIDFKQCQISKFSSNAQMNFKFQNLEYINI